MKLALMAAAMLQGATTNPVSINATTDTTTRSKTEMLADSLEAAQLRFFYMWGDVFRLGHLPAYRVDTTLALRALRRFRDAHAHCHPTAEERIYFEVPVERVIASGNSSYAVCASWLLGDSLTHDEARSGIDIALDEKFRPAVKNARAALIAAFGTAARRHPENDWIVGQHIRLLVDQGSFEDAFRAAKECLPARVWCSRLTGYALSYRPEKLRAADSAFSVAMHLMPQQERCLHSNVHLLLEPAEAAEYLRLECAARDSVDARFWWLANPMWSEGYNERRVAHHARAVHVALRQQLDRDERYDWRARASGQALVELVTRYGWPSLVVWSGMLDMSHSQFLTARRSPVNAMYSTFEYAPGALHTVPSWRLMSDVFAMSSSDWTINDPAFPARRPITYEDDAISRKVVEYAARVPVWWPREHVTGRTPIVELPEGQTVFLRRSGHVIVATATMLHANAFRITSGEIVNSVLISTTSPDSFQTISRGEARIGTPMVLYGAVAPRRTLLGIELETANTINPVRGRVRFGVEPSATLDKMATGEVAVSEPILLHIPPQGAPLESNPDALLPLMRADHRVRRGERLGLYWESYGIQPQDTVHVAVWMERHSGKSVLRQLGEALNITPDLNTPIAMAWREDGVANGAVVLGGRVPVISRSIVLDLRALTPGEYWLDVVIRKPGHPDARSRRTLTVTGQ